MVLKKPPTLKGLDFGQREIEKARGEGKLLRIGIETSRICNMHCPYCYANAGKKMPNELEFNELCNVIVQAKALSVKTVAIIGGGEPLMYDNLFELINYINGKKMTPLLFTNGSLVTKDIAKRLYEKNVSVIAKLNSFDDFIQDELAGVQRSKEMMMSGIKNLIEAGFNKSYPTRLGIESIICKKNYADIPLLWRFCRERNIYPYFELVKFVGRARLAKLNIAPEKAKKIFYELLRQDQEIYGYDWIPSPPSPARNCRQHYYSCYVNSEGNVQPCSGVNITVGNVREKPLKDILGAELFGKLRNITKHMKGMCRECDLNQQCYGCRGDAFNITGDLFSPDVMCWRCNGHSNIV